jgi:NADPH2:quinone reductase
MQVGILSGAGDARIPLNLLLHNHLRLHGTVMKSRSADKKGAMVDRFGRIALSLLQTRAVRPLIHAVLPLDQAQDAHGMMEAGGLFGKIVLTVN